MASIRDDHGRIKTPRRFASPDFRAHALTLHRAGLSIRSIAAETGRSKTALARDLELARSEEAAAKQAALDAKRTAHRAAAPERRAGASVLVLDGAGRLTRADGSVVASKSFTLPKRRYTEGQLSVMESNEHAHLLRVAYLRAGLRRSTGSHNRRTRSSSRTREALASTSATSAAATGNPPRQPPASSPSATSTTCGTPTPPSRYEPACRYSRSRASWARASR